MGIPDPDFTIEGRAEKAIEIARMFEAYSCGDLDMAAAEQMAE